MTTSWASMARFVAPMISFCAGSGVKRVSKASSTVASQRFFSAAICCSRSAPTR